MTAPDNTIDPRETDDFLFDWAGRLAAGETITAHSFVAAGVTVGTSTATGTSVTVRLSAATGAIGTVLPVLCRVTTSTGRILYSTWQLVIVEH